MISNTTDGKLVDYTIKSGEKEIRILVNASAESIAVPSKVTGTLIYGNADAGKVGARSMVIYEVK